MVRKEIYAHMIAYNLIRDLIVMTAIRFDTSPKLLSHKAAVQALGRVCRETERRCKQH